MIFGFINKAARKVHLLCKKNSIVALRTGGCRTFTESKTEKEIFHSTMPKFINAIATSPQFTEIPQFSNTIKQILEYNLTGGEYYDGLSTLLTYKLLEKPEKITEESMELCRTLAWCLEMVQAYWLILDDITDKSVIRQGKTCWYLLPDVGMRAINDTTIIYASMLNFLKENFKHLTIQYPKFTDQINKALIYTSFGQHLDYKMTYQKEKDYIEFTDQLYDVMVKCKTSYYTHILPVYFGLILANIDDVEVFKKVKEVGNKIGRLHQMQNDYRDTFTESETDHLGANDIKLKLSVLGNDIQEGKFTWLAVKALQNCNGTQRKTFTSYYGSPDPEHVEEIRTLYKQLKLPEMYKQERHIRYDEITRLANDFNYFSRGPELFLELLDLFIGKK